MTSIATPLDFLSLLTSARQALAKSHPALAAQIDQAIPGVPEITAMPCISIAHLSERDVNALAHGTGWAAHVSYTRWHDYGFICYVHTDAIAAPVSYTAVRDWARARGWEFLRLDQDAQTVPGLPVYEW